MKSKKGEENVRVWFKLCSVTIEFEQERRKWVKVFTVCNIIKNNDFTSVKQFRKKRNWNEVSVKKVQMEHRTERERERIKWEKNRKKRKLFKMCAQVWEQSYQEKSLDANHTHPTGSPRNARQTKQKQDRKNTEYRIGESQKHPGAFLFWNL